MPGPYPLATLAPTISATGITAPSFADIFASLQASYQGIFGSDVVLDPSSQDGQFLAVIAQAQNDSNAATIAVYNAFSPATAQGAGLSSVVKINGIERETPSNSTAPMNIVGQTGTEIVDGVINDGFGNQWALPALVEIPDAGEIAVTATCGTAGAITAAENTITQIANPQFGWQSATNTAAATVGAPVETDATLRIRQSQSTAIPSLSVLDGILGAVGDLPGVQRFTAYENDTSIPDANGVPGHSIAVVVEGGDITQICNTIALKKTPGTGTYGTTSQVVVDSAGVSNTISFFIPTQERILVGLTIKALQGYLSTTGIAIQNALAVYVAALPIGAEVDINGLVAAATLPGLSSTYKIVVGGMLASIFPAVPAAADITIPFNAIAELAAGDVSLTVDT